LKGEPFGLLTEKLTAFVELQRAIPEFRGRFDVEKLTLFVQLEASTSKVHDTLCRRLISG
jgi:hypothetical protein